MHGNCKFIKFYRAAWLLFAFFKLSLIFAIEPGEPLGQIKFKINNSKLIIQKLGTKTKFKFNSNAI